MRPLDATDVHIADHIVAVEQPNRQRERVLHRVPLGRLLAAIEKSIDDERITRGRGDPWYFRARSVLYALLERDDDALTMLEECFAQEHMRGLALFLATDPAYDRLRAKPRFRALVETVDRHIALQRAELDQMRIKKLVPWRTRG